MSQRRFVAVAAAVGAAIPLVWLTLYWVISRENPALQGAVTTEGSLDVISILWPSWLLLMADPEDRSISIPAISVAINAALYGAVGWLVWFGLHGKRSVLMIVVVALLCLWYALLRWMYTGA